MKKFAYTLAEVLISLAIIGIITVLTVPAFINNTKAKSDSLLLKSTYKQVNDAILQAMYDQGVRSVYDLDFEGNDNQAKLSAFLHKYLDVIKDCGGSPNGCFGNSYTSYVGSDVQNIFSYGSADNSMMEYVQLSNGVSLAIRLDLTNGTDARVVMLDVNGSSPKNAIGKDLFAETINNNGTLGSLQYTPDNVNSYVQTCKSTSNAEAAEACMLVLKAKDWNLETYLD